MSSLLWLVGIRYYLQLYGYIVRDVYKQREEGNTYFEVLVVRQLLYYYWGVV